MSASWNGSTRAIIATVWTILLSVGVLEFPQLFKINPRKSWQMVRLPCLRNIRTHLLGTPPSASSSRHPHSMLPAPHTAQPAVPAHSLSQPLTLAEVEAGLQQLHNGRSSALHSYTSELRYAKLAPTLEVPAPADLLAPCLVVFFIAAFSTGQAGQMPHLWKTFLVTPVFEKGVATDTANCRPISVGEPISRLYASILVQLLVKSTELQQLPSNIQDRQLAGAWHHSPCLRPSACH